MPAAAPRFVPVDVPATISEAALVPSDPEGPAPARVGIIVRVESAKPRLAPANEADVDDRLPRVQGADTAIRSGPRSVVMDGWHVLAQEDLGLRFVPRADGHPCHENAKRTAPSRSSMPGARTGFLPLREHVRALAAWGRSVYAAVEGGGILRIDAVHPEAPVIAEWIRRNPEDAGGSPVEALDALGTTLYVLTREGLTILETAAPAGKPRLYPEVRGLAIRAHGRLLHTVREDGSAVTYRDTSLAPLHFDIAVDSNDYTPDPVDVAVGDTVRWTNVTGDLHNVSSCTTGQTGCLGVAAAEQFRSGSPTGFFVFDHIFVHAGVNRYICQPHAPFMVGTVTVSGSTGTPPGVSDGTAGVPVQAVKLVTDGSILSVTWDTASCQGAGNHEILYGYPYGLPPGTGGGFEPAGSRCGIGTTSPFVWTAVPPAFPGPSGLLWWLIVATDGAVTEGSWGRSSSGLERQGPGPDGSSLECGIAQKSLTNACGH